MKTIHTLFFTTRRKAKLAFNLIEVTISTAIILTAVTVLLGMFPVGLKASRDAADYTMASILANSVMGLLQSSAGGGTFTAIRLSEWGTTSDLRSLGTISGATTFTVYYQQSGGTLLPRPTVLFNAAVTTLTPMGTVQPLIFFFDSQGRSTTNTGTGTATFVGGLGNTPALWRLPYYRVEVTLTPNSQIAQGASIATVLINVRWPCISNLGTRSGWRPRRGAPTGPITSSDVFLDNSSAYFGIIIQNNR
jgi:hypothetical protein